MKTFSPGGSPHRDLTGKSSRYSSAATASLLSTFEETVMTDRIAVVGAGLVGSLCACFLGNRGYFVDVFEYRDDIRQMEVVPGRSINLALSERGRVALRAVGLEEEVIDKHAIPMYGRLIHDLNGNTRFIPYGKSRQCIYSVGRRHLNEILLTAAEKNSKVKIHFQHKLKSVNFDQLTLTFSGPKGQEINVEPDAVIGCDGAYSAVRHEMMRRPMFNYSQKYIRHGYMEFCIPPTSDGKFAMQVNCLHIWPRGEFMMIALPNQDKTYTVTLFMPFSMFKSLKNKEKLIRFFMQYFPDALPLIGEARLSQTFFNLKASPLMHVKCSPYHVDGKSLIIGDAAHATVPFFGQGMNAGFEDCYVLNRLLEEYNGKFEPAFSFFTEYRHSDAEALVDLSLHNYLEMRDHVNSYRYLFRKYFDSFLNILMPSTWIPLYSMVTFTTLRYNNCIKRRQMQDNVLKAVVKCFFLGTAVGMIVMATRFVCLYLK